MARKDTKVSNEKAKMTASKHSQKDGPTETGKTRKPLKRALEIDPVDEIENQIQNNSQRPQKAKRRSRKALSSTSEAELLPSVDAEVPSPAIIPSKSEHKPGTKLTEAESLPPWGWDVTGDWILTCPQLATMLELEDSDPQTMTIKLANNPRHTKVGRQLWATFDFGNGCLTGNMRFCPHVESNLREDVDMKDFEKACVLKNGEWVGPPPNGMQKWNLRWRGVNLNTGIVEAYANDQYQTDIEFSKGEDGRLTFTGVIMCRFQPMIFRGVKTGEGKATGGNDVTVTRQWLRYKPRGIY